MGGGGGFEALGNGPWIHAGLLSEGPDREGGGGVSDIFWTNKTEVRPYILKYESMRKFLKSIKLYQKSKITAY